MPSTNRFRFAARVVSSLSALRRPTQTAALANMLPDTGAAHAYADTMPQQKGTAESPSGPLWEYFQQHRTGHGLWKWQHYFEVYDRHLAKFAGQNANLAEIGIYSGGSLEMWQSFLGPESRIFGIDIHPDCGKYATGSTGGNVLVWIGDQENHEFWHDFTAQTKQHGGVDILIDDGGHTPEQQRVTLEEMLPALNPGGVYLCEDVHGEFNRFAGYASGLAQSLNAMDVKPGPELASGVSAFQSSIASVSFYPFLVVIEKRATPLVELKAPRHGTQWEPFLRRPEEPVYAHP